MSSFTWADWVRYIVTPLVIVAITAIVSTRNSRKKPHERLKNLVDIHNSLPDDMDRRGVVKIAIARELVDFDRRMVADQRGVWTGFKERVAQRPIPHLTLEIVARIGGYLAVIGGAFNAVVAVVNSGGSAAAFLAATSILVISVGGGYLCFQIASHVKEGAVELKRDRVAAWIL